MYINERICFVLKAFNILDKITDIQAIHSILRIVLIRYITITGNVYVT